MRRTFDRDIVREGLRVLHEYELNVTRSFFYLPDFMPAPDTIELSPLRVNVYRVSR